MDRAWRARAVRGNWQREYRQIGILLEIVEGHLAVAYGSEFAAQHIRWGAVLSRDFAGVNYRNTGTRPQAARRFHKRP